MGLTFVGAAGAAAQSVVNTAAAGAARGGRNAELQWKGKHSDNAFRLDPGHCHHLSNPNVLIAYNKWATNQSTAKKAPYWAFYDELKAAVGKYSPVWRCVGCHPVAEAALALYEQTKELKDMPKGLVRYLVSFCVGACRIKLSPIRLVSFCTHPRTFLVCCPDFCMYVHTHTRTHARMHACMNMRACTHACMYER